MEMRQFNWGQININFQSVGAVTKVASSYWSTRNRSAPLATASTD